MVSPVMSVTVIDLKCMERCLVLSTGFKLAWKGGGVKLGAGTSTAGGNQSVRSGNSRSASRELARSDRARV